LSHFQGKKDINFSGERSTDNPSPPPSMGWTPHPKWRSPNPLYTSHVLFSVGISLKELREASDVEMFEILHRA